MQPKNQISIPVKHKQGCKWILTVEKVVVRLRGGGSGRKYKEEDAVREIKEVAA